MSRITLEELIKKRELDLSSAKDEIVYFLTDSEVVKFFDSVFLTFPLAENFINA